MTMDRGCTGRFATSIDGVPEWVRPEWVRPERGWPAVFALVLALACTSMSAAERPPEPPLPAQAAQQVADPEGLRARLMPEEISPVRSLDPAIFTELSPVTASDPAVRLPQDQREAGQGEQAQPR